MGDSSDFARTHVRGGESRFPPWTPAACLLGLALAICMQGALAVDGVTTTWRIGDRVIYSRGCHDAESIRLALTGTVDQIAATLPSTQCFEINGPMVAVLVTYVDGPFLCHGGLRCSIWEVQDQGRLVRATGQPYPAHVLVPVAPEREYIVLFDDDGRHQALVVSRLDPCPRAGSPRADLEAGGCVMGDDIR